ncbi:hypothetical protein V2J09_013743, partial [Rumex salicifolius]
LDGIYVIPEPNPSPERAPKKRPSDKAPPKKSSRQGGEKRNKWSQDEELLLTSAWVLIRSAKYYNKRRVEENKAWVHRASTTLKSRWHNIAGDTQRFVGCYTRASNRRGSGENEVDVIRNAHTFFHVDYGVDFLWEHVWREVQHEPKWCNWLARESRGSSKRSKLNESGIYSSSSNSNTPTSVSGPESVTFSLNDSAPVRPIGIKNAKKKGKQAAQSSSEHMETNLEKVDRLTMLQAYIDMQKQEAKKEAIKEQKKIVDDYVRTQKLQMLT